MLYVTLRQMEYAVAVAHERSLSGAAARLNVSQPSLSNAITQVEARLGQRLFRRRRGAPVVLTPEGETYIRQAERLLASARRLEDPSRRAEAATRRLRLGIFNDLAPFHLGRVLDGLKQRLPQLEVHPRIADLETLAREMLDGQVDLALSYDLGYDASFRREELGLVTPRALVAAAHPLAQRAGVLLAELAAHPLILFEEGLSVRHMLRLFRDIGARPRVAFRVGSLELMRSLAARGAGIGISYSSPALSMTYDGLSLATVPIEDDAAAESLVLVRAAELEDADQLKAARQVISSVMKAAGD